MTDLQSKLQNATEGSRELSDEVLLVCGWRVRPPMYCGSFDQDATCIGCGNRRPSSGPCILRISQQVWTPSDRPDPSRNLQDAVSLLTDGEEYEITNLYGVAQVGLPLNTNDPHGPHYVRREDGSVCLAFCEAIIKAHEARKAEAA